METHSIRRGRRISRQRNLPAKGCQRPTRCGSGRTSIHRSRGAARDAPVRGPGRQPADPHRARHLAPHALPAAIAASPVDGHRPCRGSRRNDRLVYRAQGPRAAAQDDCDRTRALGRRARQAPHRERCTSEVLELVEAFNGMLDRLESSFQRLGSSRPISRTNFARRSPTS